LLARIISSTKGWTSVETVRAAFGKALPLFPLTKIRDDGAIWSAVVHSVARSFIENSINFSINSAHFLGMAIIVLLLVHIACAQIGIALGFVVGAVGPRGARRATAGIPTAANHLLASSFVIVGTALTIVEMAVQPRKKIILWRNLQNLNSHGPQMLEISTSNHF